MDAPPSDLSLFDRVREALVADGPLLAIDRLCDELRRSEDYPNLFLALLMRKRVELGVMPFPTGPATELPPESHADYEEAIRAAGREVGHALLACGDIPKAWQYFRMLSEPEPVRQAIADYQAKPDEDPYPVIELAWQEGLLPKKGFDLVLDLNGVCSAITMVSSADLSQNPDLRTYCVQRLVRVLYEHLRQALHNDLTAGGVTSTPVVGVEELIAAHPELVADNAYHADVSHLSSVVQMAMHLPSCPELDMAREICGYCEKLSPSLRGTNDPPFQDTFADYRHFLNVMAGKDVDAGLDHFRAKLALAKQEGYQFPAEVMVNLLVKAERLDEALAVAKEHLAGADERHLSCPGVTELARRTKDYGVIADVAREKSDPVNYLAGLIAGRSQGLPRP